jgi:hypothetical protein
VALSGGAAMSAIAPLMGVDQTSIRPVEIDANDLSVGSAGRLSI